MEKQENLFGQEQESPTGKRHPLPQGPLFPLPGGFMSKIEQKFWNFHHANPHVYQLLVKFARQWRGARGIEAKLGIKALFERVRWETGIRRHKEGDKEFKLNNNYTAYYARLIMQQNPGLHNIFQLRKQRITATIGPKNDNLPPSTQVV